MMYLADVRRKVEDDGRIMNAVGNRPLVLRPVITRSLPERSRAHKQQWFVCVRTQSNA